MVRVASGFIANNGLQFWIIQRITALVLGAYTLFLVIFILTHQNLSYSTWNALLSNPWMRFASLITLFSLLSHAWIGIWTVTTDYIKPISLRLAIQWIIIFLFFCCFMWGIESLWSA